MRCFSCNGRRHRKRCGKTVHPCLGCPLMEGPAHRQASDSTRCIWLQPGCREAVLLVLGAGPARGGSGRRNPAEWLQASALGCLGGWRAVISPENGWVRF